MKDKYEELIKERSSQKKEISKGILKKSKKFNNEDINEVIIFIIGKIKRLNNMI